MPPALPGEAGPGRPHLACSGISIPIALARSPCSADITPTAFVFAVAPLQPYELLAAQHRDQDVDRYLTVREGFILLQNFTTYSWGILRLVLFV